MTADAQVAPQAPQQVPAVPFVDGTYHYSEIITTLTATLTANAQQLNPINITPGGFLRGVTILVTSTGGVLGTGALSADSPWSLFQSISLESIDGTPILYPMSGYAHYLAERYTRPWDGDPAVDSGFSNTINPSFRLPLRNELRATLGVLPNTDARAQYRLRLTLNPLSGTNPENALLTTLGTATTPTITIVVALETYAQPPRMTLSGAPVAQIPDGIGIQRFLSFQNDNIGTGVNTVKQNRTGNLIRTHLLVVRDSSGNRVDLTADPIRFRVDNTQLLVENRNRRDWYMWQKFQVPMGPSINTTARPTGVYVFPRWQDPGIMDGMGWLETSEATFLQYELNGGPSNGVLQTITEDLSPVNAIPAYLENI